MVNQWYYGRAGDKQGPFSALQLKDLAATGRLLRTDTVWKEGGDRGFLAATVERLFGPLATEVASETGPAHTKEVSSAEQSDTGLAVESVPPVVDSVSTPPVAPDVIKAVEPESGTSAAEPPAAQENPTQLASAEPKPSGGRRPEVRRARATAVTGAIIVRVDDTTVVYRKKCAGCGHEDVSQCRIPIRNGVTRLSFFCPKCRKARPVQIQCVA
jgi:hypothetical protein